MRNALVILVAGVAGGVAAALTTFAWMFIGGRVPPTIVTALVAGAAGAAGAYLMHRRRRRR